MYSLSGTPSDGPDNNGSFGGLFSCIVTVVSSPSEIPNPSVTLTPMVLLPTEFHVFEAVFPVASSY